jgi:ribosomal peptide maturation radical SAM protein 1
MSTAREPLVLLIDMPWATGQRPSIALGILRRLCDEKDVAVRTFYANLDMAALVGFETAGRFSNERHLYGLSEHVFAVDIFGREALDSDRYLAALSRAMACDASLDAWKAKFADLDYLRHLRDEAVPKFLDKVLARVLMSDPTIVGFTATFNQVMSSLALAHRIKIANPKVQVIAGGACFDGEMGQEYHRAMPGVLDHVFMGEAEESFRDYLTRVKAGRSTCGIPGVTSIEEGHLDLVPGRPLPNLNDSPMPDYDEFFLEAERVREETGKIFNIEFLPFESARGCWWGEKNHCVFCGINPDLMGFRPKDIDRVIDEIVTLSTRYRAMKLTSTDWIISRWHCDELFRRLADMNLDIEIFYEVRADLKKSQLGIMKQAGIVNVQPGIESFSTPLLKLMKKGTKAIRNVQFIRWCKEFGIDLSYNILAGFPGERAEWYLEMVRLIQRIPHLQPPLNNITPIEMHRFSPLYEQRESFGVDDHFQRPDYAFNLPVGYADPLKTAYFFSFHSSETADPAEYMTAVQQAIAPWLEAHREKRLPTYEYAIGPGFLRLTDTRHGEGRYLKLAEMYQDVVLLCDEMKTRGDLARDLSARYPQQVTDGTLDRTIDDLLAADVLMAEDTHLLTLPIGHKPRTTEELRRYVLGADVDHGASSTLQLVPP